MWPPVCASPTSPITSSGKHNVVRFVAPFDHPQIVWYYVPVLLMGLLPGSLLLVSFVRFLLSGKEEDATHRGPELGFLLLAAGWLFALFHPLRLQAADVHSAGLPRRWRSLSAPSWPTAVGASHAGRCGWRRRPLRYCSSSITSRSPGNADHRSPVRQEEVLRRHFDDPSASVVCYPRACNVVAFRLRRDDLRTYRSKDIEELRTLVRSQPRTVILCTHRNSLKGLRELLPAGSEHRRDASLRSAGRAWSPGETTGASCDTSWEGRRWGLSDLAVVEFPRRSGTHNMASHPRKRPE